MDDTIAHDPMLVTVTSFGNAQAEKGHFFLCMISLSKLLRASFCTFSLTGAHLCIGEGHQLQDAISETPSGVDSQNSRGMDAGSFGYLGIPLSPSRLLLALFFIIRFTWSDCTVLQSPVRSWKDDILETVCIANKAVKQAIENGKAVERKQRTDFAKFWKSVARGCSQQADGTRIVFDRVCIQ